ncbi:MAG: hypothetical protein A4E62_01850 [Syntrophorhabdus sp. PtaU1.Bin002]|nr:MAG: hypothetical protein A4E62_01850 [Syntrophorhabdus sp. PtaU1.Bin002]
MMGQKNSNPGLQMRRPVFLFALLLILSMLVGLNAGDLIGPKPPYSIEQLRAWHKSMEGDRPWLGQPEQKVHLRTQKDYELLLATGGYARAADGWPQRTVSTIETGRQTLPDDIWYEHD